MWTIGLSSYKYLYYIAHMISHEETVSRNEEREQKKLKIVFFFYYPYFLCVILFSLENCVVCPECVVTSRMRMYVYMSCGLVFL